MARNNYMKLDMTHIGWMGGPSLRLIVFKIDH